MNKEDVINGIKERLFNNCELRPSEVLVLKDYINQLETNRDEAIKLCNYLLKTDSVCINGKVYYKQKDDDVITRRIIEELDYLIKAVNELKKGK